MTSGTIHSSGTAARSVVRYIITPRSRLDGTQASSSHEMRCQRRRRQQGLDGRRVDRFLLRSSPERDAQASEDEHGNDTIAGRPESRLRGERQPRLNENWIRDESDEAARIAGGIQKIRVARRDMSHPGEVTLQQRRRGREDSEGKAHRREHFPPEATRSAALPRRCEGLRERRGAGMAAARAEARRAGPEMHAAGDAG